MTEKNRIVVINDDPTQLRLVGRLITRFGYEVSMHLDAADALESLARSPNAELFIVDLHMPGIDGWKLCRLLRSPDFQPFNDTPILVVSATFTGTDVEAITADLGANAFLPLPFTREDLRRHVADLLKGKRPRRRSSVLVVEDDNDVALAVTKAFEANGFDVTIAPTVNDARTVWQQAQADVVLLDYHLPDATCEELLSTVVSQSGKTVVIVMTGDTDPALPTRLLGSGADAYVRKPFDPAFLVELTRKAQREHSLLRVKAILEQRTQELKSSERRFRSLFDTIPDLVFALDGADRIVRVNDEVVRKLSRSRESLRGTHLLELVPPDMVLQTTAALDRIRHSGSGSFETTLLGPEQAILVETTGVSTENDCDSAVVLVARDLTWRRQVEDERRRIEEQMQHTQRLESLGVLAGGIAHDFNNLLVGILGNATLAILDSEEGLPVLDSIRQIETAAKRAAELTQQILTFSGKGNAVLKPVDLSELVSEMGQLLEPAVSKKARLSYHLPRTLEPVEGDASQIRQVVMNLIMNASDALGGSPGTIRVETSEEFVDPRSTGDYYLADTAQPGQYACLQVSDEGCGMDAATIKQIFDPFFTTKFTGRGLGLAAALGIVRTHKGLIAVTSKPGKGTTFRLLFPSMHSQEPTAEDDSGPGAHSWTRGGSVLVVDDEYSVRNLARATLRRSGFQVALAEDGVKGLEMLGQDPNVSMVILDLTMPELDGLQVLAKIRASRPSLPVLLSSGYTTEAIPPEAMTGHTAFLRKPYMPTELVDAVTALLSGRVSDQRSAS